MRIGILTFHAQQNYGGVLQCFAMKSALESLGHEVVVIDRWLMESNSDLKGMLGTRRLKTWTKILLRAVLGGRDDLALLRAWRSVRFVNSLGLTRYHFVEWKEAPKDIGVDLVVVGSDQVWHCGDWSNPAPYLLEDANGKIPRAISYAASFGRKSIPDEYLNLYKRGFARFSAISCREKEGVEICRRLGFEATHVVDPTLLADPACWDKLLSHASQTSRQRKLTCYFMSIDLKDALPKLEAFAKANNCLIEVITNKPYLKALPKSFKQLVSNLRNPYPRVKVASGYGPKEFVRAFAAATCTMTDSFHAVMFSSIFNKNLRFVKPDSEMRKTMFARIEEFAASCINGPIFVDSVQSALDSFTKGETISYNREEINNRCIASLEWLKKAVGE